MAKTLVEVNTDTALDLSTEIKQITFRMNSFVNFLKSTDARFHSSQLERDRKIINSKIREAIDLRRENNQKIKSQQIDTFEKQRDELNLPEPKKEESDEGSFFQNLVQSQTPMIPPMGLPYSDLEEPTSGPVVEVGTRDYAGREIKLSGPAADAFSRMAKDAAKEGLDIGKGISSSYRSEQDQIRVYKEKYGADWRKYYVPNSNHMYGNAFDINWDSKEGIWIRKNASKYGFKYNTYSGDSTHFDYVGGSAQGKRISKEIPSNLQSTKPIIIAQQPQSKSGQSNYSTSSVRSSLNTNVGTDLNQIIFSLV